MVEFVKVKQRLLLNLRLLAASLQSVAFLMVTSQ
jgi:hypothetical protein